MLKDEAEMIDVSFDEVQMCSEDPSKFDALFQDPLLLKDTAIGDLLKLKRVACAMLMSLVYWLKLDSTAF